MIILGSSKPANDDCYYGGTSNIIEYRDIKSCITLTCIVGDQLIGIHLFHRNSAAYFARDLDLLAELVSVYGEIKAIYVVGALKNNWYRGRPNSTGYYCDDGSFYGKVRQMLAYTFSIDVFDTSDEGEVSITASMLGSNVSFAYSNLEGELHHVASESFFLEYA